MDRKRIIAKAMEKLGYAVINNKSYSDLYAEKPANLSEYLKNKFPMETDKFIDKFLDMTNSVGPARAGISDVIHKMIDEKLRTKEQIYKALPDQKIQLDMMFKQRYHGVK